MIDQKISALQLPRMRLTELKDFQTKPLLKSLEGSQNYFAAFQDERGDLKVVHTGLNESLYALMLTAFHRHVQVHDFVKIALHNIDMFRDGKEVEANELMNRAVEYYTIKLLKP